MISEKSETVWNRRPGLVGLRLRSAMVLSSSNRSMRSPSARVTMARLVSGRLPKVPVRRLRLRLPLRLSVFTLVTLTPKIASTASRISGLVASGWTLNV